MTWLVKSDRSWGGRGRGNREGFDFYFYFYNNLIRGKGNIVNEC